MADLQKNPKKMDRKGLSAEKSAVAFYLSQQCFFS
jgi:hypothetical protein